MLSEKVYGMHRHTRSSKYVDRKKMKRTVKASRPGTHGFSFTGEFPETHDWMPVEATSRRRNYTRNNGDTNGYRAVSSEDTTRLPVVNRYGVRVGAALVFFVVLGVLLAGTLVMAYAENAAVSKRLAQQTARIETLSEEANTTLSEIANRSNGVNIRQEASRIGLRSSRGMSVEYLDVPVNAVIGPGAVGTVQDLASVWGN